MTLINSGAVSRQIHGQLPWRAEYRLQDQEQKFLRVLGFGEALTLARAGYIRGIIERNYMSRVQLEVPLAIAIRLLNSARIKCGSDKSITKSRNTPLHWRERLDRSDSGLTGSNRTVFIGKRINLGAAA